MKLLILNPMYFFFFFFFFLIPISCESPPRYTPSDNIALDCGNSGRSLALDGRYWDGELGYSQVSLSEKLSTSGSYLAQKQPTETIPYNTARISRSEFIYVFPVSSSGPKFIRLHFHPSAYQDFDPSKGVFSVKANDQFTLLSNFNAALIAASLGEETVEKEFYINLGEDQREINITFTPSNTSSDAYAFINGIEIVSMPTDLYYGSGEPFGFTFIGQQNLYHLQNYTALETVHRLNVGGRSIPPTKDTGMYRKWLVDDGYYNNVGMLPENTSIKLSFTKVTNYTAPDEVYQTGRSMGNNKTQNEGYNLTWSLPIDSGFTYMVRLHFCEFQPEITKLGDRAFRIYMANQTAEDYADVIFWSDGNGVPVYRDYAVILNDQGRGKKQNLSLAIHPGPAARTVYSDAILNGIEVFKLSDFSGNLASFSPQPANPKSNGTAPFSPQPAKPKSTRTALVATICGGILSGVIALSVVGLLIFWRSKRMKDSGSSHGKASWQAKTTKTGENSTGESEDMCRRFSLTEIQRATNNFDDALVIGKGGFGKVYKGFIDDGATTVAIKRLNAESKQGAEEFWTEIKTLSNLRYVHLVTLIGYSNDCEEMILVYEYMVKGTLAEHLYTISEEGNDNDVHHLTWEQRVNICIGAARGLDYLHTNTKQSVIHRDVKTTNILLDENWIAKISDFGLSKISTTSHTHISTNIKGTFGYLDQEYFLTRRLTKKSDVYAFGVVLFEVLCARPPVDPRVEEEQCGLALWAQQCIKNGTLDQIIDPSLKKQISSHCLKKFAEVANKCLHTQPKERPTMAEVVGSLERVLALHNNIREWKEITTNVFSICKRCS